MYKAKYKAKFPYEATSDTDIHLNIGDNIIQVEDCGNGWSLGHNATRGTTGTFPSSYITNTGTTKSFKSEKKIKFNHNPDDVTTISKENSQSTLIPKVKAKIPDQILQHRLSRVPGKTDRLSKFVPQTVKSAGSSFFQSAVGEHRCLKGILGIFGGFIACGILFLLLRYSYGYTFKISAFITAGVSVPICAALAFSTHMRCIMLLMVPSLFTGKGRAVFMSIIFAALLAGPVVNITYNAQQASESMACTQELIYEQTLILKSQLEEPIRKLERYIYNVLVRVKLAAQSIKDAIAPVTNAVRSMINGLNAAKYALEKAAEDCSSGLEKVETSCKKGINHAKSECERVLRKIDPTEKITNFGKKVAKETRNVVRNIGRGLKRWFGKKRKRRAMTEEEKKAIELAKQLMGTPTSLTKHGINLRPRNAKKIKDQSSIMERQNVSTALQSSGLEKVETSCKKGINHAKSECERVLRKIDPTEKITNFGKKVAKETRNVVRNIGRGLKRWFGKKRKRRAMTEEEKKAIELAKQLMGTPTSLTKHGINLRPRNAKKIIDQSSIMERQNVSTALQRYRRSLLDQICVVLDISEVCKAVRVGQAVCIPLKFISKIISKASNGIEAALVAVVNFFYFDFDGNIDADASVNSSKTAAQIISEVKADILSKSSGILSLAGIVSNILVLTLFVLFIKSIFYLKKFQTNDRFDNFYITNSFKQYDAQCKASGKPSVLPLKRKECSKYVDTRSLLLSKKELEHAKEGFGKIGIHLLIATVIIFFDYLLYFVLTLIDRYGNLNIHIGGSSTLEVSVEGSGLIAMFLATFLRDLDLDSDFGVTFNLTTCIPNPSEPNDSNIFKFSFFYFFAFVFVIMQAYGLRVRRKIAALFYPERDAERVQYLHQKIRHKRKSFFSWIKHHLVSCNKQQYMENRITFRGLLEYKHPHIAKYLCCCLPKKTTCIGCSNEDDRKIPFHKCPKCGSNYCEDCYSDMNYECLICKSREETAKMK